MKQDSLTIECKSVKDSVLHISGNKSGYTIAEAQAAYDAYIAAGYTQFDAGDGHSLDVSGEADANILIVWKADDPHTGEYRIKGSYITDKNVVILGVKLNASDEVTDANLKIYVNEIEDGAVDYPVIFDGIEVVIMKMYFVINWTNIKTIKSTIRAVRNSTITANLLRETNIYNYAEMTISSSNENETAAIKNDSLNTKGIIKTTAAQSTPTKIAACGAYIFVCNGVDTNLEYYNRETGEYIGTLDTASGGFNTDLDLICAAGKYLYGFAVDNSFMAVVYLGSAGPELEGVYLNASAISGWQSCVCDHDHVYYAGSGNNLLYRFAVDDFSSGYSTLNLSVNTDELGQDLLYVYSAEGDTGNIKQIEKSSFTVNQTLTYTTGMGNGGLVIGGGYLYRGAASNYSGHISVIKLSDGSETQIDTYSGQYINLSMIGFDGKNIIFSQNHGTYKIYSALPGVITNLTELFSAGVYITNGIIDYFHILWFSTTNIKSMVYNTPILNSSVSVLKTPDPAIIDADDYKNITLAKLRTRYYTPPEYSMDETRLFYMAEFDPLANVPANFKKFASGRTLIVDRPDITAILAASGTEKKIISGAMFDNDGITPFTYGDANELPADENFFMLAEAENGSKVYFAWYDETIKETYFSIIQEGIEYTIKRCFQLWKRRTSEIDLVNVRNDPDSPLEGTIEFNNQDNEYIIR